MAKKNTAEESFDEGETNRLVEVKVSSDGGETWFRRKINMALNLEESGLRVGELFKLQEEQYRVLAKNGELQVEKLKNPVSRKQPVKRK